MNSDEVLDAGFNDFDDLEVKSGGGGFDPLITTVQFDVGLFLYAPGIAPADRFYSFTELTRAGATNQFTEKFTENNDKAPLDWQLEPHIEIVISAENIINREPDDMPNWKNGLRIFHFPMRISGDREREQEGWVAQFYEKLRPTLDRAKEILDTNAVGVLNKPLWASVGFERDEWELWQIARAQDGEKTWNKYKEMTVDDVNWIPAFRALFTDEKEARSGLDFEVPTNDAWIEDYGPWAGYFRDIVKAARDVDDVEQLNDFLMNTIVQDEEGNDVNVDVVTEEHLRLALEAANDLPF